MTFNPEKHLMELQGKAYLEVKWRLVWFRQECPNGTIDTEEVIVDLDRAVEAEIPTGNWIPNPNRIGKKMPEKMIRRDNGYARFRAVVTDGKGGRATATKSENAASFPDYLLILSAPHPQVLIEEWEIFILEYGFEVIFVRRS